MMVRVFGRSVCLVCALGVQACMSNESGVTSDGNHTVADAGPGEDAQGPTPDGSSRGGDDAGPTDHPSAELCDGADSDGNGIVDDLDRDGDGICDCLKIATIGTPREQGASDFENWLDVRSGGVVELAHEPIDADVLEPFQVIIVQDVTQRSYADQEVSALEDWVRAGGGLFAMSGYALPDANVNKLIAPYGVQFDLFLVLNTDYTKSLPVDRWRDHPIAEGVESIGVASAYPVNGAGEVFAEGQDPLLGWNPIGRALTFGQGKVAVWGDEWISKNSEWANRTDYQVERLWQNLLSWLAR